MLKFFLFSMNTITYLLTPLQTSFLSKNYSVFQDENSYYNTIGQSLVTLRLQKVGYKYRFYNR